VSIWRTRSEPDSWERRREEMRKYDGDVAYQVWRNGGNPDMCDPDRVNDRYWEGQSADEAASGEIRRQREDEDFYHDTDFPCGY